MSEKKLLLVNNERKKNQNLTDWQSVYITAT